MVDTSECVSILDDHDNPSDHFAIFAFLPQVFQQINIVWNRNDVNYNGIMVIPLCIRNSNVVSQCLSHICLPVDAFLCRGHCTGTLSHTHEDMLERYYQELIHCMNEAAGYYIPVYKPGTHKHWWTPELDELKQQCIQATGSS